MNLCAKICYLQFQKWGHTTNYVLHTNNMNPYAKLDNFLQVHDLTYIIGQIFAVFSNKNA